MGTSKRRDEYKDLQLMPVFCTAEIPEDVLNEFLNSATNGRTDDAPDYRSALLTTTDISSITSASTSAPPPQSPNPFLNWTVDECYQFFLLHISRAHNEVCGPWTAHTFVVLDTQTAADHQTCCLCSDVPDFLERDRIVLKTVRSRFDPVLIEGMCYETFVRRPSESGGGVLGAGEVLTGKEEFSGLSFAIPMAVMAPDERRLHVSYVVTSSAIKEGRFWERNVEENERADRERMHIQKA